jgi:1,4-alpha-glucan branching enzyme
MYAQPGKKLLFMGAEMAQPWEWNHDATIAWELLETREHAGVATMLGDLNNLYRRERALHQQDCHHQGFEWLEPNDAEGGTLAFLRWDAGFEHVVLAVFNFTPVVRHNYRVGVPRPGRWRELFNSDAEAYGGSGAGNLGSVESLPVPAHGRYDALTITLPPLAALFFTPDG